MVRLLLMLMPFRIFQNVITLGCSSLLVFSLNTFSTSVAADYKREETLVIDAGMALTASLEILKDMANGSGPKQAWLALGHSGWQPGQLDRELQDNAWLVIDGDPAIVFDTNLDAKWQRALDTLGGKTERGIKFDPASYSHQVGRA